MSRRDELLKLANMFHLQAKLSGTKDVKWALRKMGDEYQFEAEKLQGQSAESQTTNDPVMREPSGIDVGTLQKMRRRPRLSSLKT